MRIAVCDDEQIYIDMIFEYCRKYFEKMDIEVSIDTYTDGNGLIDKAELYDIVLLDVEMPQINGIDIKKIVSDVNKRVRIIFISAYPENMPEAFGDRVMGFLVKPLLYETFTEKMKQVLNLIMSEERYVTYEISYDNVRRIMIKDIMYIKADGKYSHLHTKGGIDMLVKKGIREWENELGSGFIRCHKSWLINISHVKFIKNKVIMMDGSELPIGRTMNDKVKHAYEMHILEEGMIWSL